MKRNFASLTKTGLVLIAVLLMTFAACNRSGDDVKRSADQDYDFDYDFTTGDEEPGFGDPEIQAMTQDEPFDDPFDVTKKASSESSVDAIFIRIMWGNLVLDAGETEWRDYSGQMTIDDGLLVIERTVAFDPGDSEIETREDPTHIAWTSRTRPHFDGLLVRLEPGAASGDQNKLHIAVGPYAKEISVSDLADYIAIDPTGYGDDHVAMASHLGNDADSGFLLGRMRINENGFCVLKGKWETSSGSLIGHERARCADPSDGEGRLRGKAIDLDGNFLALLDGTYQDDGGEEEYSGAFGLDFLNVGLVKTGEADGVYLKETEDAVGFILANYYAE
jgi:hypothetical protein